MSGLKKIPAKISDAELSVTAQTIITNVSNNQQSFQNITPYVEQVKTTKAAFDAKILSSNMGDESEKAKKAEAKHNLLKALETLRLFVQAIANGNKALELLSGYEPVKERSTFNELGEIENLKVTDGAHSGELCVSCNSVSNVRSYTYYITPEPITSNSVWRSEPSSSAKHTFTNLDLEKKYHCKVVAVGSNDQTSESGIVSRVVQ